MLTETLQPSRDAPVALSIARLIVHLPSHLISQRLSHYLSPSLHDVLDTVHGHHLTLATTRSPRQLSYLQNSKTVQLLNVDIFI